MTFSLLALEVVFTRLYSYIFTHGYVYLIISMGMSGIGAGCFLYYRFGTILKKIFFILIFMPILIIIALFVSNFYSPNLIISLFLTTVFFGNLGVIITHIYTTNVIKKHALYFIDFAGAATGSIAFYFMMQSIGVPKTLQVLFIVLTFSVWLIYTTATDSKKRNRIFSLFLIVIISSNLFIKIDSFIRLPETNFKEIKYFINDGEKIIDSSWKAFGKVDLVSVEGEDRRVMFVFPQFFLMGTIFPSLLSMVQKENISKMIALNSTATVVGSVMAVMIAMTFGFVQTAVLGSLFYLPLTYRN